MYDYFAFSQTWREWGKPAGGLVLEYDNGAWNLAAVSIDHYLGELKTELPETV